MRNLFKFLPILVLVAHAGIADTRTMLEEMRALHQDLELVERVTLMFNGIDFSDPARYPNIQTFNAQRRRDLYAQALNDTTASYKKAKGEVLGMKFRDENLKARIVHMVSSTEMPDEEKDLPLRLAKVKGVLARLHLDLCFVGDGLKKRIDESESEIVRFLEAARLKNPAFLSEEQRNEILQLERAIAEAKLRKVQLELEVDAKRRELADCESKHGELASKCLMLEAQVTKKSQNLSTIFENTLNDSIREFHRKRKAEIPKTDEKTFFGLNHLPPDLKEPFQESIATLFDEMIVVMHPSAKSEGLRLKLVVQVNGYSLWKANLTVSLSAHGSECPIQHFLEQKIDKYGRIKLSTSSKSLRGFFTKSIPRILEFARENTQREEEAERYAVSKLQSRCRELQAKEERPASGLLLGQMADRIEDFKDQ